MTRLQNEPPSATREPLIDEMIDETFPASDAPQLTGRRDGGAATTAPDAPARGRDGLAHGVQPTIGNQGSIPASGVLEETVPLSDQGVVHLRFDGGFQRLHIYLGEEGLALDAAALDRLIAVLSQKRARM
ncbi:MAG TPA: hypothetical protein VLR71_18595 [Casimicrobiaceae bacterium]|nr:hypothetical protein [Casimicrobiaceae bacterium]